MKTSENAVGEQYLPARFLEGLLPTALTDAHAFFQENKPPHRVIRGYPKDAEKGSDHTIEVKLVKQSDIAPLSTQGWAAVVTRVPGDALLKANQETEMRLLDLLYASEGSLLHSLAALLVRLENLSHVLAWTKSPLGTERPS